MLPALRELGCAARAGLGCLVLTLLFGLGASGAHLWLHHQSRDERPGLSLDDVAGVYRGIRTRAPLASALQRGHPDGLPAREQQVLQRWLEGGRISEDWDSLELGDQSPAEVMQRQCIACHARKSGHEVGQRLPLEYFDDVKKLAFARDVAPVAREILVASAHTHALGMGSLTIVAVLLALSTRWPRGAVSALTLLAGAGLLVDLGSWLLASEVEALVPAIAVAGATWMAATALLLLLVLAELCRPGLRPAARHELEPPGARQP